MCTRRKIHHVGNNLLFEKLKLKRNVTVEFKVSLDIYVHTEHSITCMLDLLIFVMMYGEIFV